MRTAFHRARPILLKYGQDLANVGWYVSNAAHAATRPFDGTFLYLTGGSNNVFNKDADLTLGSVQSEMTGFHAAALGQLLHNFPVVRITVSGAAIPDWWNDTHWTRIAANWGAFAQGVQGSRVKGLAFDNEHYFDSGVAMFDWVNGGGIDPTHTLAQSQAKVRARGEQCMDAVIAVWPNVRVVPLHGPYVSDDRPGVSVWTDTATDPPYWNPVAWANELLAWFTFGMADACVGTAARVYDGGEIGYAVRSMQGIRNARDFQLRGMPSGTTIVPVELQGDNYRLGAASAVSDFDEFNGFAVQAAAAIENEIAWAMRTSDIAWYYTEKHDWWTGGYPDHLDIDAAPQAPWFDAVVNGRLRGRGAGP